MKVLRRYFLSVLAALFTLGMTSCDPMQTIEIQNKSETKSIITFHFKGTEYHEFEGFWQEEPLTLNLAPKDTVIYDFGLGTWEMNNSLDSLVVRVDKVKIESEKSTEIFEGNSQIQSFFEDRFSDDDLKSNILIIIE